MATQTRADRQEAGRKAAATRHRNDALKAVKRARKNAQDALSDLGSAAKSARDASVSTGKAATSRVGIRSD